MKIDLPPLSGRPSWVHPVSAPLLHPHFVATVRRLNQLIDMYPIVPLVGPTGVGKTGVAHYLMDHYNREVADQPQFLRAAMVNARTRRERVFSYKELWRGSLAAVNDTLPERKVVRPDPASDRYVPPLPAPRNASQDDLFGDLRKAVVDRRLRVLFVDEALALFLHCSRDHLERTLDSLCDLTRGLGFTVVLVATPRLLAAWRDLPDAAFPVHRRSAPDHVPSSAEFGRQRMAVYFGHYDGDVLAEHELYGRTVRTLFDRLPSELRPRLRPAHHREFIDRTNGCIGETIDWLTRAVKLTRHHGDVTLRWEHFADTALPDRDRDAVRDQCKQGKQLYEEFSHTKFDSRIEPSAPAAPAEPDASAPPSPSPPVKRRSRSGRRVGVPKAKRHKVA